VAVLGGHSVNLSVICGFKKTLVTIKRGTNLLIKVINCLMTYISSSAGPSPQQGKSISLLLYSKLSLPLLEKKPKFLLVHVISATGLLRFEPVTLVILEELRQDAGGRLDESGTILSAM